MGLAQQHARLSYSIAIVLLASILAPVSAATKAPRVAIFGRPPHVKAIYDKLEAALLATEGIRINRNAQYRELLAGADLPAVVKELSSGKRDDQIAFVTLKRALASAAIDPTKDALARLGVEAKAELLVVARVTKGKAAKSWDLELRLFDVALKGFEGKPLVVAGLSEEAPTTATQIKHALGQLLTKTRSGSPKVAKTIRPPFYKQWWFWVIVGGVAAVGTTFAVIGLRKKDRLQLHITR
ncbi:MAG: hypothetical protein KC609_03955 [Myxococcales bacterium]|nr:hypothetical protein [Myxococcales bacterium]